jgi:hypothetical protein
MLMDDFKKRRGYVDISDFVLEDLEICKILFSKFFPVMIERPVPFKWDGTKRYYGRCMDFDPIEENEVAPGYLAEIKDGQLSFDRTHRW